MSNNISECWNWARGFRRIDSDDFRTIYYFCIAFEWSNGLWLVLINVFEFYEPNVWKKNRQFFFSRYKIVKKYRAFDQFYQMISATWNFRARFCMSDKLALANLTSPWYSVWLKSKTLDFLQPFNHLKQWHSTGQPDEILAFNELTTHSVHSIHARMHRRVCRKKKLCSNTKLKMILCGMQENA